MEPAVAVRKGYERREQVVRTFFDAEAARLAELCHEMARRFVRGGRLIAFGTGGAVTDAQHVAVEFVHPVIVGKRALPAIALPNDIPTALGFATDDPSAAIARQLEVIGRPDDIALGMVHSTAERGRDAVDAALKQASAAGMLSVSLGAGAAPSAATWTFSVDDDDPFVVQEVHETLYHVLWELVHVFFDHKGLLTDRPPGKAHDVGGSGFLYPFLTEAENDLGGVLADIEASVRRKAADVIEMRSASCDPDGLAASAAAIAERIAAGSKVLTFGNGGSATDAQDLASDLVRPPAGMRGIPALSLTNDAAVVTAVGNDVGFENVFARQVIAYGEPGDVAIAISTSGGSRNVLAAVTEARRRGMLTVGFAGYGGGSLAELCDHAQVIDADYIPRIQEAQATQYHLLRVLLDGFGLPAPREIGSDHTGEE